PRGGPPARRSRAAPRSAPALRALPPGRGAHHAGCAVGPALPSRGLRRAPPARAGLRAAPPPAIPRRAGVGCLVEDDSTHARTPLASPREYPPRPQRPPGNEVFARVVDRAPGPL